MWELANVARGSSAGYTKPWVGENHGFLNNAMLTKLAWNTTAWGVDTVAVGAQRLFGRTKDLVRPASLLADKIHAAAARSDFFNKSVSQLVLDNGMLEVSSGRLALTEAGAKAFEGIGKETIENRLAKSLAVKGENIVGRNAMLWRGWGAMAQKALFRKSALMTAMGGKAFSRALIGATGGAIAGYIGWSMIPEIAGLGMDVISMFGQISPKSHMFSNNFGDANWGASAPAQTMRQAGLAALHNSQMNIRSVLGNEAGYMHR